MKTKLMMNVDEDRQITLERDILGKVEKWIGKWLKRIMYEYDTLIRDFRSTTTAIGGHNEYSYKTLKHKLGNNKSVDIRVRRR